MIVMQSINVYCISTTLCFLQVCCFSEYKLSDCKHKAWFKLSFVLGSMRFYESYGRPHFNSLVYHKITKMGYILFISLGWQFSQIFYIYIRMLLPL